MPSLKDIRDRIRSVSNTAKITSAMQLIAASRMQRAQQMVRNGRPYADQMREVLSHLTMRLADDDETLDPLLQRRPNHRELLVLLTPDRGLAGALVGNILRAAAEEFSSSEVPIDTVGVGRKGERFVARTGQSLVATFSVGDRPTLADTLDISSFVIDRYRSGEADTVKLIYAQFVNTTVQNLSTYSCFRSKQKLQLPTMVRCCTSTTYTSHHQRMCCPAWPRGTLRRRYTTPFWRRRPANILHE